MTGFQCEADPAEGPAWGLLDVMRWKLVPERFEGGRAYIQRFKDAWVSHNKLRIQAAATEQGFPAELLAGVCWVEVAGDPNFIDRVAFEVRAFDYSGPDWVDRNMTITKRPEKTSFGSVSMQLATAANTLGLDVSTLDEGKLRELSQCLEKDAFNIRIVARHLRQIIDHDGLQTRRPDLSEDAIRVAGARYNRGLGLSLESIRKNTSYGDFILKIRDRLVVLLK